MRNKTSKASCLARQFWPACLPASWIRRQQINNRQKRKEIAHEYMPTGVISVFRATRKERNVFVYNQESVRILSNIKKSSIDRQGYYDIRADP